jgi:ornithine decarboxylase
LSLKAGDRLQIETAGAYVSTYAAQSFNGFTPLAEYYL